MTQEKRKWRVAIAGCHRMVTRTPGSHNFAAAFNAVPEVQVVSVFDFGAETRAEFVTCWRDVWGEVPTYDDYGRMLSEIRPDLLCIATRQTMHADQIELAVQSGVRGILCDKPLATSLEELDRISAACQDVPLLFALDRRWYARYRYLRGQLADGIISPVTSITAYGLSNLINHGCHWYDTLLALAGDIAPEWVSGFVEDISGEPAESRKRLDPSGRAQIGLSNGVVLYITADGRHQGPGLPMSFGGYWRERTSFPPKRCNGNFRLARERPLEYPPIGASPRNRAVARRESHGRRPNQRRTQRREDCLRYKRGVPSHRDWLCHSPLGEATGRPNPTPRRNQIPPNQVIRLGKRSSD